MKYFTIFITIATICINITLTLAEELEYIWPTDASRAFTSSFAEYRPRRFHAGVDIKTWGKTGYELYAIRDGYISRLRVSPFGYGKCIYLTLDTGETVVYGHMDRFCDAVQEYIWQQQTARNSYEIQLFPPASKFVFKQGDLIGYSGQTGIGYPHLHFELRDAQSRPINPLDKGYKVNDGLAPYITKVALTPMDAFSTVNSDWKPIVLRPKLLRASSYVIEKPLVVNGLVGFAFSAYDQMENITNKYGTYKNQLFIDERLIFSAAYKRFAYDEDHMALLDRDFRLAQWGHGNFYKLYRDFGNTLSFYFSDQTYYGVVYFTPQLDPNYEPFAGVKVIPGGSHTFRIVAQDYWGNTSQVIGKLEVREAQTVSVDQLTLQRLLHNHLSIPDSQMFKMDYTFFDKYLRLQFTPKGRIPDSLAATFRYGNSISMPLKLVKKNGGFTAVIQLNINDTGPLTINWLGALNGTFYRQEDKIDFQTIPYASAKTISTRDDSCTVTFYANSLYQTLYIRSEILSPEKTNDYTFASNVYKFSPQDVAMYKGATIKIHIGKTDIDPRKVGIYYKVPDTKKWRYFGNSYDPASNMVSGKVTTFGTHALIVDDQPPELMYLYPSDGSHIKGKTSLKAVFKDALSGIGSEKDREMRIDGKKVIAEYDPEHLTLVYKPRTALAKGKHELEMFLRDKCGNITSKKQTFWVD